MSNFLPCGIIFSLLLVGVSDPASRAPEVMPVREVKPGLRQITLSLNRAEVTPGSTIRLTETIPADAVANVISIHHEVVRIGGYDVDSSVMIPFEFNEYSKIAFVTAVFEDLNGTLCFSHASEFPKLTPRTKGTEIEFTAKRLGIFLIRASWSVKGETKKIPSLPIILVVGPPRDQKGKPLVKPEWLEDDQ